MIRLNDTTLADLPASIARPRYDRERVTAGIAHFSVGNFHRAHQAVYLDRCLEQAGQAEWGILGIGLMDDARERSKLDVFPPQNGLYTLTEFPPHGGETTRVVGSIVEYLHAPDDRAAVLDRLCDPAIRIVSMTVTEGGYNIDDTSGTFQLDNPAVAADLANPDSPQTVFGFVVEALARRRQAGTAPFTVLSCDNLRNNGDVAKTAFMSFAHARDAGLAEWMAAHVTFPNCMVDRITPATLAVDAERLNAASGIDDGLPVFAEDFIQWVVEDRFVNGRPALETVGVQMTDNVHGYEQVKLRMLNASHNMLCFPGLLVGYRLAHETMADPLFHRLLNDFMTWDVIPLLHPPSDVDLHAYKDKVLERFGNPAIGDQLLRIAGDGASKIPVFVQDTLRTAVSEKREIRRLAFLIACFTRYLGGKDDKGEQFPVIEPHLSAADLALAAEGGDAPLRMSLFKNWGLLESPAFVAAFVEYRTNIAKNGTRPSLSTLLDEAGAS